MTKHAWSAVKSAVINLRHDELISLVAELYRLSRQNQTFLHDRFADVQAAMADCKKTIADCLYSDALPDRPLQFAKAKKVVADFCKAVADPVPHADLMLFFVEQGNSFSVEYGDIDSGFYTALLTMGRSAVQVIGRLPYVVQESFRERLAEIVRSSSGIG